MKTVVGIQYIRRNNFSLTANAAPVFQTKCSCNQTNLLIWDRQWIEIRIYRLFAAGRRRLMNKSQIPTRPPFEHSTRKPPDKSIPGGFLVTPKTLCSNTKIGGSRFDTCIYDD